MPNKKNRPPRLTLKKKIAALPNKCFQTYSIKKKNHYALGMPNQIMVEPSGVCNLRCPTCIYSHNTGFRSNILMPLERFKKIVDEVKSFVSKMPLFNYGEPFLNRDLIQMIQYANSAGIYTITNTNGQFTLSPEDYKQLVRSGLKHLIFSFDGLDQDVVGKFRYGIKIDECVNNLRSIIAAKRELNATTPFIDLQFIVMKYNSHLLEDVKKFGKEIGVDRVIFKSMWVSPMLDNWQELFDEFVPTVKGLSRYKRNEDDDPDITPDTTPLCKVPWRSCVINADGTVVACCYDLRNQEVFGNVFERPFGEIWNGEKYRDFRKRLINDRNSIEICRSCSSGKVLNLECL